MVHSLQVIKNQLKEQNADLLYMQDYFNVDLFHPGKMPLTRSPYARIINGLLDALRPGTQLPHLICILPGKAAIQHIDFYAFGVSKIIRTMCTWMVTQVNRLVTVDEKKFEAFVQVHLFTMSPNWCGFAHLIALARRSAFPYVTNSMHSWRRLWCSTKIISS